MLVYRTGAYAPNGCAVRQWLRGHLKLVTSAAVSTVKISYEECEPATPPTGAWSAVSA